MAIKTLIIDDTIIYRRIVSDAAASFPELEVIGVAATGDIGLKKMEQGPVDLVFCDVYMPGKDGVETLVEIRSRFPETIVVMMSGVATRAADITIKALQLGALDFIQKPEGGGVEENTARLKTDIAGIIRIVKIRRQTLPAYQAVEAPALEAAGGLPEAYADTPAPAPSGFGIVAIGVSTGGPEALGKLLPLIPRGLSVPVVLVQHMPQGFTRSLAESLDKKGSLHVVEAADGQAVEGGTVYIAPGGRHMTVRRNNGCVVAALSDGPPENSCRPSVDVLFRSVADVYGSSGILAVILTGMGSDGLGGIRVMKRRNCYCITQSAQSCVVYGMPRAVDEAKLSDKSLSLDEIAEEIARKTGCR
jgi:two-component system chemotaxis response regulator CheB